MTKTLIVWLLVVVGPLTLIVFCYFYFHREIRKRVTFTVYPEQNGLFKVILHLGLDSSSIFIKDISVPGFEIISCANSSGSPFSLPFVLPMEDLADDLDLQHNETLVILIRPSPEMSVLHPNPRIFLRTGFLGFSIPLSCRNLEKTIE
ncbi:hypothetical protein [uncultured Parasutterella sp.]|jgi:hypothetical protein|uniref:hypothetical protein n=1 Tax=uncultured Parasutterella sp. TaxID=1263098 RepID=UPI002594BDAE|nr:hypothetical protein [uncultured Parasutterella sp.]